MDISREIFRVQRVPAAGGQISAFEYQWLSAACHRVGQGCDRGKDEEGVRVPKTYDGYLPKQVDTISSMALNNWHLVMLTAKANGPKRAERTGGKGVEGRANLEDIHRWVHLLI